MGQAISSTQFYLYGKRHFTATGYQKHKRAYKDPVQESAVSNTDGVSLKGKTIAITGANSGIGRQMAIYAACKGATTLLLCRSMSKAEAAKEEIIKLSQNEDVHIHHVDVGELSQVRRVVEELPNLDVLVCNAGALLDKKQKSSEGREVTFASHLLGGTYLLTELLYRKQNNAFRTIVVTSGGMYTTPLPAWNVMKSPTEKEYDGTMAYAYAKRGQVILVDEWAKTLQRQVCTAHPGWSGTTGVDTALADTKKYLEPLRSEWEGAEGICWLLGTPTIVPGALYLDRTVQRKHLAGAFFSEGSYTKNSESEIAEFMENLKEEAGL